MSFSEVSGPSSEITYADYRDGTDPASRPRKVPLTYKGGDVAMEELTLVREGIFFE